MTHLPYVAKIHLIYLSYSPQVAKYNKNEDLKETGECLVLFKFKFGYVKELLFVAVPMNSNKNGSFMVGVQQTFIK